MPRSVLLWLTLLAGPLIWLVNLGVNYVLAPTACSWGTKAGLYWVSFTALGISVLAALTAFYLRSNLAPGSAKLLANAAIVLSCSFAIVILAQAIPNLMLPGCA